MSFESNCAHCGVQFEASRPKAKYCSRPCYWASLRKLPRRSCPGCGRQFDPRPGKANQVYCDRSCYAASRVDAVERWLLVVRDTRGCWPWPHGLNKDGYGVTWRHGDGGQQLVHRVVWTLLVGPIPDGLTLDHMCHNNDPDCAGGPTCLHRRCANPACLVVAEGAENTLRGKNLCAVNARKTHCARGGHPLSGPNLYINPSGGRQCRACQAKREREYRKRKAAA